MKKSKYNPIATTASVFLTISFYTAVIKFISPLFAALPGLDFILGSFASVGFYVSVFEFLNWLYNKFLHDKLNPKEAIVGEWFYKLDIAREESEPRYGICRISEHQGEMLITGIHFDPSQEKFTSRFRSESVRLDNDNLVVMYSSAGVDEEIFTRRGVFYLQTEEIPPKRIYGVWTDVLPSRNAGDIVLQRRDENTDAILNDIGYPLDSSELQKMLNLNATLTPRSKLLQSVVRKKK